MTARLRVARRSALLAVASLALLARPSAAGDALDKVQAQFKEAIKRVTPATVVCVPAEIPAGHEAPEQPSSGVIVSRKGLVLSDVDAGVLFRRGDKEKGEPSVVRVRPDLVDVRVPDLARGGYTTYRARVLLRSEKDGMDTSLMRVLEPPSSGFASYVPIGGSDHLEVGDFAFVIGNAFGMANESSPALTVGVVSALSKDPPEGEKGGKYKHVYTSAAVNPGVNGGPMVDAEGRLVATISTWVAPDPRDEATLKDPFQFLGKAIPIARLRAVYGDLPEAAELFAAEPPRKVKTSHTAALESAFHAAAQRAYPTVVSLEVKRTNPISRAAPGVQPPAQGPARYVGPVSGVVVSPDGWIVTGLYNLANIGRLEMPWWEPGPDHPHATVEDSLAQVESITVHTADGRRWPAKVAGHDPRSGLALVKAEIAPEGGSLVSYALPLIEAAPAASLVEGRFVLALGNPFGSEPAPDPLLSIGILSKRHAEDAPAPWRGQWQTDAGVTDANCGGAVVDLQGRLVGVLNLWTPARHGRNSGIAFVVPWSKVLASVADIREGKIPARGFIGVAFRPPEERQAPRPVVDSVVEGSAGEKAGLKPGDRVLRIGGEPVVTTLEALQHIWFAWEGEKVRLTVLRDGRELEFEIVLGARSPGP